MIRLVEVSRTFRAMNTRVEGVVCVPRRQKASAEQALDQIQGLFCEAENKLSRFRPESELSLLNRSAGKAFKASDLLYEAFTAAVNSSHLTGGICDGTILACLKEAGYDRSFETLDQRQMGPEGEYQPSGYDSRDIKFDQSTHTITLPKGGGLDFGGIAKGWTADRAGLYLEKLGNYAVNAGGDIVLHGTQSDGRPWRIGIADPLDKEHNILTLHLSGGAVCTSTITQRRWLYNGVEHHHIIDPRSGRPADSGVISATVIAETAVRAETIAKASLILGPEEGLQFIEKLGGARGLLILRDGKRLFSPNFDL